MIRKILRIGATTSLVLAATTAIGAEPQVRSRALHVNSVITGYADGSISIEQDVQNRLGRIQLLNPQLHAVIALNPHALADARALDAERTAGKARGPLHGVPILLKDNIESADDTATTAGSLALKDNVTGRDAPLVRRLTDAGMFIT